MSLPLETTYQGVCELVKGEHPNPLDRVCNRAAMLRYPAMNGGYMHLCELHGQKHASYCERWDGTKWVRP